MADPSLDGLTPLDEATATAGAAGLPNLSGILPLPEPQQTAALSWAQRLGQGAADPLYGTAQLAAHLMPQVDMGVMPTPMPRMPDAATMDQIVAQREQQYQAQRTAAGQSGTDWWRLAGNVASPMNFIPMGGPAASIAGRLGMGALRGALTGAEQPTAGGDDYWSTKVAQAGLGGAGGAVMAPVAEVLAGSVKPAVQMLQNAGVTLTPGQQGGAIAKGVEAALKVTPIARAVAGGRQQEALNTFNTAIFNKVLEPIGENLEGGATGHEAFQQAAQKVGNYYDNLLPQLSYTPHMDVVNGLANIESGLPPASWGEFRRLTDDLFQPMQGDALKKFDSNLSYWGDKYSRGNASPTDQALGDAISDARDLMRDRLMQVNPQSADQLLAANKSYAMLKAAEAAGFRNKTGESVFTPSDVLNASARTRGGSQRAFVQGRGLLQPFAEAAQSVIGSSRGPREALTPGSLLATDILGSALGLGSVGTLGAAQQGELPSWIRYPAYVGMAALPFTRAGQAALRNFSPGGPVRRLFGSLGATGPSAVAGSLAAQR